MVPRLNRQLPATFALCGLALLSAGCPVTQTLPAPGQRLTLRDPQFKREYHLYVPSYYHAQRRWPLVVTCHGTRPFDTAPAQLDEWKGLAEARGFLVAAPELVGTSALEPAVSAQIGKQVEDEKAILAIVRDISAARNIDDTRVFLTGWSAGSYAVLYTGLRHPDIFRALVVRQGNFKAEYFEPCVPFLDRYQPVLFIFGNLDPLKDEGLKAIDWLKGHALEPQRIERTGPHRRDPEPVYSFFVDVVRHRPWIRITIEDDPQDPMTVRLGVKASFEPARYLWDFGDDSPRTNVATPVHRYQRPGAFTVKLAAYTGGDRTFVRQIQLKIPRVRLGTTAINAATSPR